MSGIVFGVQSGLVVGKAIVAVTCIIAVLGEFVTIAIGVLVSSPRIVFFGQDFSPRIVVAVIFRFLGTDVA